MKVLNRIYTPKSNHTARSSSAAHVPERPSLTIQYLGNGGSSTNIKSMMFSRIIFWFFLLKVFRYYNNMCYCELRGNLNSFLLFAKRYYKIFQIYDHISIWVFGEWKRVPKYILSNKFPIVNPLGRHIRNTTYYFKGWHNFFFTDFKKKFFFNYKIDKCN